MVNGLAYYLTCCQCGVIKNPVLQKKEQGANKRKTQDITHFATAKLFEQVVPIMRYLRK